MTKLFSHARVVVPTRASLRPSASALCGMLLAASAAGQAHAASVLSITGTVTSEVYMSSTPFSAPAASVLLSFDFDEAMPLDTGGASPGAFTANYESAALSATIDVLDAAGAALGNFEAPDPFLQITNRAADAAPDQLRLTSGDGGLPNGSPFERFEIFLDGDGSMFSGIGLAEITDENLKQAALFSQGALTTGMIGEVPAGIVFALDLASITVDRSPEIPAPVPVPPALISLMLGLAGLGLLGRRSVRNAPAM